MKKRGEVSVSFYLVLFLLFFGFVGTALAGDNENNRRDSNYHRDREGTSCSGSNWWKRNKECYENRNKPPIAYIFATKYSIKAGNSVELYLKTKNKIDSCTASGGWTGPKSKDVMEKVTPSVTTTYTITCKNTYGEHTDSTTVYVKGSTTTPPIEPPATTTPPAPILEFTASPLSIISGATSTLTWSSINTNFCLASNAWSGSQSLSSSTTVSPAATSTYMLTCGGLGGTTTQSVTIDVAPVSPPPVQNLDHLLISEVYFDVASTTGEDESDNEWIELYNGTGSAVDVGGWFVHDGGASGSDIIPNGTTIPNGGFLLLTGSSTTANFWPGKTFVVLSSNIGGGLSNTGDAVIIRNLASTTIDQMSYGSNANVFSLPISGGSDGQSFRRSSLTVDTNTASDWEKILVPTPGGL